VLRANAVLHWWWRFFRRSKAYRCSPALVILGDMSIQGNIKGVRTLVEPCQLAMENGAKRALVPIENRRQFLEVSGDVAERMDPIFYSDAPVAANKALSLS
jgi:ATP-dependent Lon protease